MALQRGKPAPSPKPEWRRDDTALQFARQQLDAYFAGDLQTFDLSLRHDRHAVSEAGLAGAAHDPLRDNDQLRRARQPHRPPGRSRAVGAANGRNPIGIIVPCHRVIGANGTLTGYGGGLDRKEWLISHEAASAERSDRARSVRGASCTQRRPA